jgi:hypothetical protein
MYHAVDSQWSSKSLMVAEFGIPKNFLEGKAEVFKYRMGIAPAKGLSWRNCAEQKVGCIGVG